MAVVKPSSDPSNSELPYPQVITRVAVAQMCLTAGYSGAEAAALHVLTDIAGRYIGLLAGAAASFANTHGRTQPNILDLTVALEEAAAGRGFAGASEVTRPLLRSSALRQLRAFVAAANEIPFPKPILRQASTDETRKSIPSFAQAGMSPPWTHVPRWLPCFPEGWESGGGAGSCTVVGKIEEKEPPGIWRSPALTGRDMVKERTRVRFRVAGEEKRGGRRKVEIGNCFAMIGKGAEVEEIAAVKNCRGRRDSNPENFRKIPELDQKAARGRHVFASF